MKENFSLRFDLQLYNKKKDYTALLHLCNYVYLSIYPSSSTFQGCKGGLEQGTPWTDHQSVTGLTHGDKHFAVTE